MINIKCDLIVTLFDFPQHEGSHVFPRMHALNTVYESFHLNMPTDITGLSMDYGHVFRIGKNDNSSRLFC